MEIHSLCQIMTLFLISFLFLQLFWPFLPSQLPFELLIGLSVVFPLLLSFSSLLVLFFYSTSLLLLLFSSVVFFKITSRHSLLVNTLAVVMVRVVDLPKGLGIFGVKICWRMLVVFYVTALFLLAGKWLGKGAAITSSGILLVAEEAEGVVVSVSITATGFNKGTSSKFSSIELEVPDPRLFASSHFWYRGSYKSYPSSYRHLNFVIILSVITPAVSSLFIKSLWGS